MTKCTASWEPSDVSFQSNKALKMGGGHFTPPPYQTRVKTFISLVRFLYQILSLLNPSEEESPKSTVAGRTSRVVGATVTPPPFNHSSSEHHTTLGGVTVG